MDNLTKSPVVFNPENHTYALNGKSLSGVTTMLSKMIFKDKYSGVPEHILKRAAERGSYIHSCCEILDTMGVEPDCEEAKLYSSEKERLGFIHVASEFLISDEKTVASSIDKVFEKDGAIHLADIKTTYKLDEDYLSWQLSVYAYLFEKQTKVKVEKLWSIWLRNGKARFKEVERKPDASVKKLIKCYAEDKPFEDKALLPVRKTSELPAQYAEIEGYIEDILYQYNYWKEEKSKLTDGVLGEMIKRGDYKWEGENVTITRKMDSIRKSFDTASFSKDYPELYAKYIKETPVVGSVTIKTKE